MKLKSALRFLVILTALILTVTMVTSCGVLNIIANYVVNGLTVSGATNFDNIRYQRPDFDAIHQAFDDFLIDIKSGKTGFALQLSLSEAYKLFNDAQTMYNIAEIRYYNDVNDTEAKDESEYCAEQFAQVQVKLVEVYSAIVEHNQSAELLVGWTDRDFENLEVQKKLYDDEYVEIQGDITEIRNEYMALQSELTVLYHGEPYTIDQVVEMLQNQTINETVYRNLVSKYYESLADSASFLYIKLVKLNNRIAQKAGYDSYQEYAYRFEYSRDYTPDDTKKVYNFVKDNIFPLFVNTAGAMDSDIIQKIYSDPHTIDGYQAIFNTYFSSISPDMKAAYSFMKRYNLASIGNESGMQQAGFTTYLPSYEMPYLYLYTMGDIDDVSSFIHEFGHFYAFYQNGFESDGIIDVSEIHSQTNELLFLPYYDLTEEEREQYTLNKLQDMYRTILEGCVMDEFQKQVHLNINTISTTEELNSTFAYIAKQYGLDAIYASVPYETLWAAISHNFVAPFYYISYAMSAIPAIQIFAIAQTDREKAIAIYTDILDETGYRPYLEVLEDNNLTTPFNLKTYTALKELTETLIENARPEDEAEATLPMPYHFLGLAA